MEAVTSSQALCLSCGFCCDGTLFSTVPLVAADALAPLRASGIEIQINAAKSGFSQPCAAHRDRCCQVYENRPASCRNYRCELLKKYERGDVSWHDAQERISRVKALKDTLATELVRIVPDAGRWPVAVVSKFVPTPQDFGADGDLLKNWAPVMLRLAALHDSLQRHFRRPRSTGDRSNGNGHASRELD
jgi:Fe-S-cluster containining protein